MISTILIVWRLTHLLYGESGPYDILGKLRDNLGVYYDEQSLCQGKNEVAKAFCCFWCLSIWVAFVVVLVRKHKLEDTWALSAGAIALQRFIYGSK